MSSTPDDAGAPRERVRIWLLLLLTILVGASSYLGVPFRDYPIGVSPFPYLSMLYLITLINFSPVRLNFTFFGPISLLCLANVAWIIGYGEADVQTLAAVLTSALMPLILLSAGILLRPRLRANGIVILHGLMFAWFAYGAFPLLPGVWN